MKAIEIKNLVKVYDGFRAVDNISFDIEEGEFFGYLGPNGAGKTTTINAIVGLATFQGTIKVFGYDVVKQYTKARTFIGIAPQEFNFDPFFSIRNLLKFYGGYFGLHGKELRNRVDELLERFDLKSKQDLDMRKLSGGMKRRLQLAKALMNDPKILILDEPTSGIDLSLRHSLWKYLTKLNNEGKTILLTTHYIEEAEKLCNRIGIINAGKIAVLDTKENLLRTMSEQRIIIKTKKPAVIPKAFASRCKINSEGQRIEIRCKNAQREIPKIMRLLDNQNNRIDKIDVIQDHLEDIYLKITGEKDEWV